MSKALLFLLATTLGLGFVTLHLVGELRAERRQVQALQARLGEMEHVSRPAAPSAELSAPSPFHVTTSPEFDRASAATATVDSHASDQPATAQSAEEMGMQVRESIERQRALLQDPEYREAARLQNKMVFQQAYPDLAQELGMNGEEMDQLLSLLADQQLRTRETVSYWDGTPDPAAMQERERKAQQQQQANEVELADLLGTKLSAWKEYQSTLGVRQQVIQLRGAHGRA
jgi:hypothetical protein